MRFAYADPPYPGQSKKHYADHPDYAGEVDHRALLRLLKNGYDGWVLHTASTTLAAVLAIAAEEGIADLMGHARERTTQRHYIATSPEQAREAVRRLA